MRKKTLRLVAVWMSLLIVMLPLYISSAFAQQNDVINIQGVKGADGINNIRKSQGDFTKIDVEVFSSKTLTAQNIQLKSTRPGSAPATFNTCTDISPYLCTWQSQPNNLPAGAYSYNACIGSCDACYQTSCKKTATIYVDGVPPTVDSLASDKSMTNGGKIKLHYKINDRACLAATCSGKCSGLNKAELYDIGDDNAKNLVGTINLNSSSCNSEADYDFTAAAMGNGERRLCMIAYDRFNQAMDINTAGTNCIAIKKDSTMPSYATVRLMDPSESYDIKYITSEGTSAHLVVNLTTSALFSLANKQLKADLSGIGGSKTDAISCSNLGNGQWSCFKQLNAKIPSSGSQSIQLSAVDEGGNNNTQTFTFSLSSDSAAPKVDSITSGNEINKVPYLKGGDNLVFAIIDETGSGLGSNNVFFGEGSGNRALCVKATDKWVCYANITAPGGVTLVNVHGYDDAGNSFTGAKNILVDTIAPSSDSVIIRNTNNNPYFVAGDDILVKALISDDHAIVGDTGEYYAYLTPEGFAAPNPIKAESCKKPEEGNFGDNTWECQWTLMNTAPGKVGLNFNISDFVGNNIGVSKTKFVIEYLEPATGNYSKLPESLVEVYEVEGKAADYWEAHAGTSMPSVIDSSTAAIVEHDVWIPVQLTAKSAATIFSVELSGCAGEDFSNYGKEVTLVRPSPKSDRPFLRITLKAGAIQVPELNFECALNIISKHKKKVSQVELENFTATVQVRAQGEFSDNVIAEVSRVSQGWLVQAPWIDKIGKVISVFTKICSLLYAIGRVIRDVSATTGAGIAVCEKFPFCLGHAQAAKVTVSGLKKGEFGAFKAIFTFCQYVSCSKTLWGKYTLDYLSKAMGPVTDKINQAITPKFGKEKEQASNSTTQKPNSQQTYSTAEKAALGLKSGLIGEVYAWGNPSNSLVLSVATGCIPGIFMNLQKARQIECAYLSCLVNDVPAGMPLVACQKVRNFQWCMFVWGEIFQIIPFIGSIKNILSSITSILRDPLTLIFGITGAVCDFIPTASESIGCHFLNSVNSVINMIKVLKEIAAAKNLFQLGGTDSCSQALQKAQEITQASLNGGVIGAAPSAT